MLSAAVKDEVRTFPDGLQRVPRRFGHGGHTRHGCTNPIIVILTFLGPDFRTTVSHPAATCLRRRIPTRVGKYEDRSPLVTSEREGTGRPLRFEFGCKRVFVLQPPEPLRGRLSSRKRAHSLS